MQGGRYQEKWVNCLCPLILRCKQIAHYSIKVHNMHLTRKQWRPSGDSLGHSPSVTVFTLFLVSAGSNSLEKLTGHFNILWLCSRVWSFTVPCSSDSLHCWWLTNALDHYLTVWSLAANKIIEGCLVHGQDTFQNGGQLSYHKYISI